MSKIQLVASKRLVQFAAGFLAGTCTTTVMAGSFSVNPVRIYMQARERAAAITVVNEGDAELVMQADLFEWKQKPDGTDELTPTDHLILAPPIIKLAPRSRQVVRLANLRPVPPGEQLTYRMVVREIPEARPPEAGVAVQVALAFSLPVFITPQGASRKLTCELQRKSPDTALAVCENAGRAYAQAVNMTLTDAAGQVLAVRDVSGGYILPQVRRSFEIQRKGSRLPAGNVRLTVTQDDGSKQNFEALLPD